MNIRPIGDCLLLSLFFALCNCDAVLAPIRLADDHLGDDQKFAPADGGNGRNPTQDPLKLPLTFVRFQGPTPFNISTPERCDTPVINISTVWLSQQPQLHWNGAHFAIFYEAKEQNTRILKMRQIDSSGNLSNEEMTVLSSEQNISFETKILDDGSVGYFLFIKKPNGVYWLHLDLTVQVQNISILPGIHSVLAVATARQNGITGIVARDNQNKPAFITIDAEGHVLQRQGLTQEPEPNNCSLAWSGSQFLLAFDAMDKDKVSQIYSQRFSIEGIPFDRVALTSGSTPSSNPKLTVVKTGYSIVWQTGKTGQQIPHWSMLDSDGQMDETVFLVTKRNQNTKPGFPIWNGKDLLFYWIAVSSNEVQTILYSQFKPTGEIVRDTSFFGNGVDASLIWNGSGYSAAWFNAGKINFKSVCYQ